MMTFIKIFFVLLLLIPIGMLMRHLLGKLSAEVPAQTDSVEIRSGRNRRGRSKAKANATDASSKPASMKSSKKEQQASGSQGPGQDGSYAPRQPEEWHRSDRVPFGESEGYRVPPSGSRRRGAEAGSDWSASRRRGDEIGPDWHGSGRTQGDERAQSVGRAQDPGRAQGPGQWHKPSDAVRERVAEDSARREHVTEEPRSIVELKGKKTSDDKMEKTGKKRSDKSPSKRQLRKNRERARKRDLKRRREERSREGGR